MVNTKASEVQVLILTGSANDLPVVKKAFPVLESCGVSYTAHVCSAHRTPAELSQILDTTHQSGSKTQVIIACAGMAAHLAGVVASHSMLPVIGVPLASGAMQGHDALHSTVQMPPGIPVATVGIDGTANAAWLAARIVASHDKQVKSKLTQAIADMKAKVVAADQELQSELTT